MQKIPNNFKPKKNFSLIRIGNYNDGGYLLGYNSLTKASCLISLGIELDIGFEEMFYEKTGKKVFMYDKSHFKYYFRDQFLISLNNLRRFKFLELFEKIKSYFKIKKFTKKNYFEVNHISYDSLSQIINSINFKENLIIKIDIEGSEYRVLDCLIKNQNLIECLIIEFHDVDLHLNKIINFINSFNLELTHVHANNFGLADKYNNPTVLEMTFEKNPILENNNKVAIPKKLDRSNNPYKKDFKNYL